MKWKVEKAENRHFISIKLEGVFSGEAHRRMIIDVTSSEFWQPNIDTLFDNREVDFSRTDISVMRDAAKNHVQFDSLIGCGKSAVIMKNLTDFARGRQFEILTDSKISAKLHIFTDEEKAVRWLCEAYVI